MSLNEIDTQSLRAALVTLNQAFADLPAPSSPDPEDLSGVLQAVAMRLQDNYPYHHPNYAGQMLKPPHPVAQLAYTLAQSVNPNNHALDGGRASSAMEKEAVAHIASMLGIGRGVERGEPTLGHLCSGGTVANLEALWVARELTPEGSVVVSSEFSHYTHQRLSGVLGVAHRSVRSDANGRMDLGALQTLLDAHPVGTVVATLGTTSFGSVDPLAAILQLRERYGFRLHVDAAYGGYFKLLPELLCASDFAAIEAADSVVIDPHKHGLQPYGCGCVLFANPEDGAVYAHDSPYTYFTSNDLHLGEISLECSRAGATAVALWATQQLLPNVVAGDFANDLRQSRQAATTLYQWLDASAQWQPLLVPDLDIVVWIPTASSMSVASARSNAVFDKLAERDIHVALLKVPAEFVAMNLPELIQDAETLVCLRVTLMKPEHLAWVSYFVEQLQTLEPQLKDLNQTTQN